MKQETVKFIMKVEQRFKLGQVNIFEFDHLIKEWGKLISISCYVEDNQRQTYLKLNQLKLIVLWEKKINGSETSSQLQDFFQYIIQYIDFEIESLSLYTEVQEKAQQTKKTPEMTLYWTASKRSLIELIGALDSAKCINKGKMPTQRIVEHFGEMFDIDLSNYHSEINKMALRKPVNDNDKRAYFLNDLAEKFNRKMLKIE
jgi:hypothetical protein